MTGSTCGMVSVSSHMAWSVEGLMTGSKCVLVSVRTVEGLMTGSKGGLVNVPQCGRGGGADKVKLWLGQRQQSMWSKGVSVNSQCGRRERLMTGSNCGMVSVNSQCGRREAAGWLAALTPLMRFFHLSYTDRRSASPESSSSALQNYTLCRTGMRLHVSALQRRVQWSF